MGQISGFLRDFRARSLAAAATTTYTIAVTDGAVPCDASGGAFTVTLPSAVTAKRGRFYQINKVDASANALTIAAAIGQRIDGMGSIVLYGRVSVTIMSDGANWSVTAGREFYRARSLSLDWFGAKLDNSTDDTTAVQAWVNACVASGRTGVLPRGTSVARVTDTITLGTAQGQRLDIDGAGSTVQVIYAGADDKAVFRLRGLKHSTIRGVNIRVNDGIKGITGWDVLTDATYPSTSFVTWQNCVVDFGTGSGGASNGIGWDLRDDSGSELSFLQWENCYAHGRGSGYGDIGWLSRHGNGLNCSWFGGAAQSVATAFDGGRSGAGESMFFHGFGTSNTAVDFKPPLYGNMTIIGGRFELGKKWIEGSSAVASPQQIYTCGCDVSVYTPSDDCVIKLRGSTSLVLDDVYIRNASATPYTAAFITLDAQSGSRAAVIANGGAWQADDPCTTVTTGKLRIVMRSVQRLSSSVVVAGWFQNRPHGVSADAGDADKLLQPGYDDDVQRWATPLTADRVVTLNTTGAAEGDHFRVVRTGSGAFSLNVGTGPLTALDPDEWCDVTFDGSAWVLSGRGVLA